MAPLALVLLVSVTGGPDSRAPASVDAPLVLVDAPPSPNDGLWWRASTVAGATWCGTALCGGASVAAGGPLIYTALRNTDAVIGYVIGFCCGASLVPLPACVAGGMAGGSALLTELFSGLTVDWGAVLWTSGVAALVGAGLGALSFVIAFPLGFVLTESGARLAATIALGAVPAVIVAGGAVVAGAVGGGMYFLARTEPDETVVDASSWSPASALMARGQ